MDMDLNARIFSARNANLMTIAIIIILVSIKNVLAPETLRRNAEQRKKFFGLKLFKGSTHQTYFITNSSKKTLINFIIFKIAWFLS